MNLHKSCLDGFHVPMLTLFSRSSAFMSCKHWICDNLARKAHGFRPVNIFLCRSILLSSSFSKALAGCWFIVFCKLSPMTRHCFKDSFHSNKNALLILKISRRKQLTISFAQRQETVVQWCLLRVLVVSSCIIDGLKWDPWSATIYSIVLKRDIFLDIVLTAASLSALLQGCIHVYKLVLPFTTKIYFRLLSSAGPSFKKSA